MYYIQTKIHNIYFYRVYKQKKWLFKVNPCIFADKSGQCQNISVVLKNKAFVGQSSRQDIYRLSGLVNEKASWISKYQAIWYIPKYKNWGVGFLESLGSNSVGIKSGDDEWDDKFPYEIPSDQFWYGDDGRWKKPGANDISIDCIDGKGIFIQFAFLNCVLANL